jgi:hypothetical protein
MTIATLFLGLFPVVMIGGRGASAPLFWPLAKTSKVTQNGRAACRQRSGYAGAAVR